MIKLTFSALALILAAKTSYACEFEGNISTSTKKTEYTSEDSELRQKLNTGNFFLDEETRAITFTDGTTISQNEYQALKKSQNSEKEKN